MDEEKKHIIQNELMWLTGIVLISAAIEYVLILVLDLHPILSVKIQAFIGLVVIGYSIRAVARLSKKGILDIENGNNHR